ncbi:MAG: hypothetical protein ACOX6H_04445 [Christensenellales bacterium]|jgi:hypothetical protein
MRRKIKFASAILSLVASMAILTFSVYAATARTATISSTVSFSGDRINTNVEVSYIEPTSAAISTTSTFNKTVTPEAVTTANKTYTIPGQTFSETAINFGIKIVLTNNFTGMKVNVAYTAPAAPTGTTVAAYKGTTAFTTAGSEDVNAGNSITFVYVYTLQNPTTAADFSGRAISIVFTLLRKA